MKDLTRAAKVKYGFSLESLSQSTHLDWDEYKSKLEELLSLSKKWHINLNISCKSGKNILQCICEKAKTVTFRGLFYDIHEYDRTIKEISKYVEKTATLGAKTDIVSQCKNMDEYMQQSITASYKNGREKNRKNDPIVRKIAKAIHKNGWGHPNNTQEKSATK